MNDDPDCHQTWPLPLLKKSVKNRKLLNKLDSCPLKLFGQMNQTWYEASMESPLL